MVVGIVPEIIDVLRPAVLVEEGPAVVLRYSSCKADYRGIIGTIRGSAARKSVRTLVSYVGECGGYGRSNLPLHAGVPLVHSGQPIVERTRPGEDPIRHKWPAVDADALCFVGSKHTADDTARVGDCVAVAGGQRAAELGCWIECRRTLSEIENESASIGIELLSSEYW